RRGSNCKSIVSQGAVKSLRLYVFVDSVGCRETCGFCKREEYPRLTWIISHEIFQTGLLNVVILRLQSLFNLPKLLNQRSSPGRFGFSVNGSYRLRSSRGEARLPRREGSLASTGIFAQSIGFTYRVKGIDHVAKKTGHVKTGTLDPF